VNAVFIFFFIIGGSALLLLSPSQFLPAMLSAGEKAGAVCVTLLSSYAIWCGFMQVMTDCKITDKLARALKTPIKKLFRTEDKETCSALAMNISANILGLGGIATPYGIRAAELLSSKKDGERGQATLFVLSSSSLQLLPTTALSLMSAGGSENPSSIIAPTAIAALICTATGLALLSLFYRK